MLPNPCTTVVTCPPASRSDNDLDTKTKNNLIEALTHIKDLKPPAKEGAFDGSLLV